MAAIINNYNSIFLAQHANSYRLSEAEKHTNSIWLNNTVYASRHCDLANTETSVLRASMHRVIAFIERCPLLGALAGKVEYLLARLFMGIPAEYPAQEAPVDDETPYSHNQYKDVDPLYLKELSELYNQGRFTEYLELGRSERRIGVYWRDDQIRLFRVRWGGAEFAEEVRKLHEAGEDLNIERNGRRILIDAVWSKTKSILKYVLDCGVGLNSDIGHRYPRWISALHWCASGNVSLDCIQLLCERGADVRQLSQNGESVIDTLLAAIQHRLANPYTYDCDRELVKDSLTSIGVLLGYGATLPADKVRLGRVLNSVDNWVYLRRSGSPIPVEITPAFELITNASRDAAWKRRVDAIVFKQATNYSSISTCGIRI